MDLNEVTITGRIGNEPELRFVGERSSATCELSVGYTPGFTDKQTNAYVKGETMWISVQTWDKLAEKASCLPQGALVTVKGMLIEDRWKDKETGEDRKKVKIRALHVAVSVEAAEIESNKGMINMTWGKGEGQPYRRHEAIHPDVKGTLQATFGGFDEEPF